MKYISVIDIGSTAVRLSVMELIDPEGDWKVLEQAERAISLGQDIFEEGHIRSSTLRDLIGHIHSFQELFSIYPVEDVILLGSYAIREANNRELFQDRILLETGLSIRLLGGLETNQLRFLALSKTLIEGGIHLEEGHTLIVDIGSSSTEVIYLEKGDIAWSDTLQIGILRETSRFQLSPENWGEDLEEHLRLNTGRILLQFREEYQLDRIDQVILTGRDIQGAAPFIGKELGQGNFSIAGKDFSQFLNGMKKLSPSEIMERYSLNYQNASALLPALCIGEIIWEQTSAEHLIVPPASAVEGIFLQAASSSHQLRKVFKKQILASSWSLAKHYHVDLKHSEYVRGICLKLYQFICQQKSMEPKHSLLLETAAILHDVGTYIGGSAHHKHGQYIVDNSSIFGLTQDEKQLVGHVVRYHRKALPNRSHHRYMTLPRESRIIVQQLSAILRVADALDRSHRQRIHFSLSLDGNRMILHSQGNLDLSLERDSLKDKADLFRDIYGVKILIN